MQKISCWIASTFMKLPEVITRGFVESAVNYKILRTLFRMELAVIMRDSRNEGANARS